MVFVISQKICFTLVTSSGVGKHDVVLGMPLLFSLFSALDFFLTEENYPRKLGKVIKEVTKMN